LIRTVLTLAPQPGRSRAVVDLFERERVIEHALTVGGCHGVEIWEGRDHLLVVATWDSLGAYQEWLDHPERNASNDALNELLAKPISSADEGDRYELALAGGNSSIPVAQICVCRDAGKP
jgi:heme-degrading monooxygenase HmoA